MTAVHVFDPAMCCSTGVCGPSVDPELARFAADLDWLKSQDISVERFNLSQQPGAFAADAAVKAALEEKGEGALPLVKVDGEVRSSGVYPSRAELAAWSDVAAPGPSLYTEAVAELVAIGAAVAANCEPCFKFHYDKARKLGVSRGDMRQTVATAQSVKDAPAKAMRALAERFLRSEGASEDSVKAAAASSASACCAPATGDATAAKPSDGCC
ncbi:MAG: arsenite efflux transporter metallochaperone ArsD [Myxococcota bacterium]